MDYIFPDINTALLLFSKIKSLYIVNMRSKCVFKKQDYESSDGMLTYVWGPSLWHFLHTMSFNYPVNPTKEDKQNYMNYIHSLKFIFPVNIVE